jgi:phosphoribosylaminoimidazolecarboxamide formyltransferase / IMP cyclohydrolase
MSDKNQNKDFKKMYKTVMDDNFKDYMKIEFYDQNGDNGKQTMIFKKKSWQIPDEKGVNVTKGLRYGDNPGQEAALYELVVSNLKVAKAEKFKDGKWSYVTEKDGLVSSITEKDMLQSGKHPGQTNMTDADNGLNILKYLMDKPTAVIIKHNNPCGVAQKDSLVKAYHEANLADRIAAFGGAAIFNRAMDKDTAELISKNYLEVVVAPEFEEGSFEILQQRKNLRIIRIPGIEDLVKYTNMRHLQLKALEDGGMVVSQSPYNKIRSLDDFVPAICNRGRKTYTVNRKPTKQEYSDLLFGWQVEQGITSNSVIYVKNGVTVGIGTGEQDRVGVAEFARDKAHRKFRDKICFMELGKPYNELYAQGKTDAAIRSKLEKFRDTTKKYNGGLKGSVMVSDAFFPFRDGIEVGLREGVTAVVQPGGSDNDYQSIKACNEYKVAMVFTGQRCFKH